MKKLISFIISMILILSLCACSTNNNTAETESTTKSNIYTGTLTDPIILDSETDEIITLKNINAEMSTSVIESTGSKSLTIILEGDNTITTTGQDIKSIITDGDLTIKGNGSLYITSDDTAIKSKDNLTIESGTYTLIASGDGLRANETLTINGGNININAIEGLESTEVIINSGTISILASDDGINASLKSETKMPKFEMNDGSLEIQMGPGDTDAIDSNGDLIVNGGKITIDAQFAFDFAGKAELNGGEVYVNREKVTEIVNSMIMNEDHRW